MSATQIEWRATNLVALGQELQTKIARVTQQFQERAGAARTNDEADRLRQRLQQLVGTIQDSYRSQLKRLSEDESRRDDSLYDTTLAGVDMNFLVYRGDRRALGELLADADFSSTVNALLSDMKPYNARKELLVKALKITRGMMPTLYEVTDRCRAALKLKAEIEVYVNQDSAFNAACYPPVKDKVLLVVTSSLLEKFGQQELAFVIGHELGHYLFEHTRFPVDYILQSHGGRLSPVHAMKMYSWIRNAEITADRVGMICCRDFQVAANTFFKLSSGITSSTFKFSVQDYLTQLDDLRNEMASGDNDPRDWFSTHPFNPLRMKALEIFTHGRPYWELMSQERGELSRDQVDEKVGELMAIMEPTYLQDTTDVGRKTQRYLLVAGYLVAAANGKVEPTEVQALATIVGPQVSPAEIQAMFNHPVGALREEIARLSKELMAHMTGIQKLKLVRDMVVISIADGSLDKSELACLVWLCQNLGVDPQFIQQILNSALRGVD